MLDTLGTYYADIIGGSLGWGCYIRVWDCPIHVWDSPIRVYKSPCSPYVYVAIMASYSSLLCLLATYCAASLNKEVASGCSYHSSMAAKKETEFFTSIKFISMHCACTCSYIAIAIIVQLFDIACSSSQKPVRK